MQTVALAKACDCFITAVDANRKYLDELHERAEAAGIAERIETLAVDMSALPFRPESFDLIWAEGSAYIMGFETALADWRRFLKPGGCIAVSELVWLRPDRPAEAVEFFGSEYPPMADIEANLETVRRCGYELLGHFTLPHAAWWEHYYAPLEAKLPTLLEKYVGDDEALQIIATTKREIEMRRRFGDWYGYEFFVGQLIPRTN